jgi:hypothetical protein
MLTISSFVINSNKRKIEELLIYKKWSIMIGQIMGGPQKLLAMIGQNLVTNWVI